MRPLHHKYSERNYWNNNQVNDLKIVAAANLSAMAFSGIVSAATTKRDFLNYQPVYGACAPVTRGYLILTEKHFL